MTAWPVVGLNSAEGGNSFWNVCCVLF